MDGTHEKTDHFKGQTQNICKKAKQFEAWCYGYFTCVDDLSYRCPISFILLNRGATLARNAALKVRPRGPEGGLAAVYFPLNMP
jgi:hypothetical protein